METYSEVKEFRAEPGEEAARIREERLSPIVFKIRYESGVAYEDRILRERKQRKAVEELRRNRPY